MDVEAAMDALEHLLAEARPVPLSASIMVNKADVDQAFAALRAALPEEIRQSRWVLKERDELLAKAARESGEILSDAREEGARLVSETETVRRSRQEAERIVDAARQEARHLRLEAEDYIDGKLASFEVVLAKTLRAVEKGREALRGRLDGDVLPGEGPATDHEQEGEAADLSDSLPPSQFYDHETGG